MASETKTVAASHSGWTTGDGRTYNNNVCRSKTSGTWEKYYLYNFGFTALGVGNTITGINLYGKPGFHPGAGYTGNLGLCTSTTPIGTAKTSITMSTSTTCAGCGVVNKGSSSDLWGVSAANLKSYLNAGTLGMYVDIAYVSGIQYWDGVSFTVYYTVPGYSNIVNERPGASISYVNEIASASIAYVNEQ